MEGWKKAINNSVKDGVIQIARQLKKQFPEYGFSLNYNLHYPRAFVPGDDTYIPITIPSQHGPYHIADVVVSIGEDSRILGEPGLNVHSQVEPYDIRLDEEQNVGVESTSDILAKIDRFLSSVNGVIFGKSMRSILTPRTEGVNLNLDNEIIPVGTTTLNKPIRVGGGTPGVWKTKRPNYLAAEAARAKNIKSTTEREAFIEESLDIATKAPHWYWALGGKQKKDAKKKIVRAYLNACNEAEKTFPPTLFFEKLQESMAQKQQVVPYCERDGERVEGTIHNQCMNRSCSSYHPNCPRFSYRLNTSNY